MTPKDFKKWQKFYGFNENQEHYMRHHSPVMTLTAQRDLFRTQIDGMYNSHPMYRIDFFVYNSDD